MATINNLYIDQGSTYTVTVQVFGDSINPLDLTGYNAIAQIRRNYASQNPSANFVATVSDAPNGKVSLSLTAADTANIKYGRYVYDVEIVSGPLAFRAAEGIVTVYPQVTRG